MRSPQFPAVAGEWGREGGVGGREAARMAAPAGREAENHVFRVASLSPAQDARVRGIRIMQGAFGRFGQQTPSRPLTEKMFKC